VAGGDRVRPIRDNPEAIEIASDQERRVLERERIAFQLIDRVVEALAPALVLPAEAPALPDVRPALAAGGLGRATLEAVPLALWVGVGRFWLVEKLAEVVEMGLRRGPLLQVRCLPFGDELLGRHGSTPAPLRQMTTPQIRLLARWLLAPAGKFTLPPCAYLASCVISNAHGATHARVYDPLAHLATDGRCLSIVKGCRENGSR
jgi:hypothetical protein